MSLASVAPPPSPLAAVGFTFDDIIALPGSIDFGVDEVALDTRITRNIPMVRG